MSKFSLNMTHIQIVYSCCVSVLEKMKHCLLSVGSCPQGTGLMLQKKDTVFKLRDMLKRHVEMNCKPKHRDKRNENKKWPFVVGLHWCCIIRQMLNLDLTWTVQSVSQCCSNRDVWTQQCNVKNFTSVGLFFFIHYNFVRQHENPLATVEISNSHFTNHSVVF